MCGYLIKSIWQNKIGATYDRLMTKLGTSHLGENEKHCGQEIKRMFLFRDIALSSKCICAVQHRQNSKCKFSDCGRI